MQNSYVYVVLYYNKSDCSFFLHVHFFFHFIYLLSLVCVFPTKSTIDLEAVLSSWSFITCVPIYPLDIIFKGLTLCS